MKTSIKLSLLSILAVLALGTGCSKKSGSSCEDIYAHTLSLMPDEFKAKIEAGKADAIAKCEKMSPEARQCALDASSMEALMKCPRK